MSRARRAADYLFRNSRWKRLITYLIADEQAWVCALCGVPFYADRPPTLDHRIPVGCGGTNERENLQAAHAECNELRGMMSLAEFYAAVTSGRLRLPEPPDLEG